MGLLSTIVLVFGCVFAGQLDEGCGVNPQVAGEAVGERSGPSRSPDALDVTLTAQSVVAWDVDSNKTLYSKQPQMRRQVASLSKLLSVVTVRDELPLEAELEIPTAVREVQQRGAHIGLRPGDKARVDSLLAASLVASANDAMVTLAVGAAHDEASFVKMAHRKGEQLGLSNTRLSNATGLSGGEQYSTAADVRRLLMAAYSDPVLRVFLDDEGGTLVTRAGIVRKYKTTNDLLSTYLPILAAKTGYTYAAGENVALLTQAADRPAIGIVILGSTQRFQDAKILAEWIYRHHRWPLDD